MNPLKTRKRVEETSQKMEPAKRLRLVVYRDPYDGLLQPPYITL